jgi:hypothetical protein
MTNAVLINAPAVPRQRTAPRMDVIAPPKDSVISDIEYVEEPDDFFTDTDPSVVEPTPDIVAVREQRTKKVLRRQRCRDKAALKPRNRMLRSIAEHNARIVDDEDEMITKPTLPKQHKRRIRKGEVPSDLHLYHVTRHWKLRIKENKVRLREAKQKRVLAVA